MRSYRKHKIKVNDYYLLQFCTCNKHDKADNKQLKNEHQSVSFSVFFTIDGYAEPFCFVKDLQILVDKFMQYLYRIQGEFEHKM